MRNHRFTGETAFLNLPANSHPDQDTCQAPSGCCDEGVIFTKAHDQKLG
jgi:hypothetical protein